MGGAGERRALNGCPLSTTHIPQHNLARISPSNHIAGMKLAEGYRGDRTLDNEGIGQAQVTVTNIHTVP